jgi:peptidoglycan/LPS O-acetylase OafA/YrhL
LTPFSLGHRPALDGIRGFAIAAVLGLHASELLVGGFIGVQVFFVLSGFVITSVLLEEARKTGTINFVNFYARRALRLLPALAAVIAFVVVLALVYPHQRWTDHLARDAFSTAFYFANWLYTGLANKAHPLAHTWSLSVEEQFYLLWPPLLAFLVLRRTGYSALLWVSVGGAIASALWRYVVFDHGHNLFRAYFGTDTRIDAVLAGCAVAVLAYAGWLPTDRRVCGAVRAFAVVGCVVIAWVAYFVRPSAHGLYSYGFLLVALFTAAVIAEVLVSPTGGLARGLSWAPLRRLGVISYGLYLWHLPLLFAIRSALPTASKWVVAPLLIAISLVVAEVSYRFLEQPFLRLKDRFRVKIPA